MNPLFADNFILLVLALWTIPWKVYAVWLSARNGHKLWFAAMLVLNTMGILEIFYIFKVANKSWIEVKEDFRETFASVKKRKGHAEEESPSVHDRSHITSHGDPDHELHSEHSDPHGSYGH